MSGFRRARSQTGEWPVRHCPIFGCHLWTGPRNNRGYGIIGRQSAHVVAWERERGPVPSGMELDHVCRRRACVALAHLELVTRSENERRKSFGRRIKRTHCSAGHDLSTNGRLTEYGGRICRICSGV